MPVFAVKAKSSDKMAEWPFMILYGSAVRLLARLRISAIHISEKHIKSTKLSRVNVEFSGCNMIE